jgi:predicted alpha/beta-hydrolase family hydrolase
VVALGHGAGGGIDAADLVVATSALVDAGLLVARFEQPWRVAGRKITSPVAQVDAAWSAAVPVLPLSSGPLLVGGRSTGARIACRTAMSLGASGVIALAFPLHPPGRPERSRADELPPLPTVVVQGDRDAFGTAHEVKAAASAPLQLRLIEVAGADHALRVSRKGPITQSEADETVGLGLRRWALSIVGGNHPPS